MSVSQKIPPYSLVKLLGGFRALLLKIQRRIFPGSVVLYEQFQAFWLLQPLYVAAELNIAGHLKEKPLSIGELAEKTNSNPEALYRVLRALASSGIFRETEGRCFGMNSQSKALLEGEGGMRNTIIHHLGRVNWLSVGNLLHTVKTGENSFKGLYGMDIYPYLQQHPDELVRFEKSMSDLSSLALYPVLDRYDFAKCKTIADIGGGEGFLLAGILKKYPGPIGIIFDLPENAAKAEEFIRYSGMKGRMSFKAGSFLQPFSLEPDLFLMKNVLHNWDDVQCYQILENLRNTMKKGSKLLILEMVVPGPGTSSYSKMVDIQMLATMPGGRERTSREFESLLRRSGLRLKRIIRTIAPLSILEAVGE